MILHHTEFKSFIKMSSGTNYSLLCCTSKTNQLFRRDISVQENPGSLHLKKFKKIMHPQETIYLYLYTINL
ncbi:hypothetical protein Hanom_Chr03g00251621 [Helianthus anomalus]